MPDRLTIGVCQINTSVGDIQGNKAKIIQKITEHKTKGTRLLVFPELTVTGYPSKDLYHNPSFVKESIDAIDDICAETKGIAVIVGGVIELEPNVLQNVAYFIDNGVIVGCQGKTHLPNYAVFDEKRYFTPADTYCTFDLCGQNIGITICEDIWQKPCPIEDLVEIGADFIVNISSSPFSVKKREQREKLLLDLSDEYDVPILYVNQIGAQDDLVFDGASMFVDEYKVNMLCKEFEEDDNVFEFPNPIELKNLRVPIFNEIERIHRTLVLGIKDYFRKSGFKKALIGLSGGIDSALTAVLACEALGAENVTGILMPSKYSSDHSVSDAEIIAKKLGMDYETVPIGSPHSSLISAVFNYIEPRKQDYKSLADQNLQARIRGAILMTLSNQTGALVLSTGNKSEMSVGYCTLYGDMCGGLNVLGDLYKTTVYALSRYLNKDDEIIPWHTIDKPPSAELAPDQLDQNELPSYALLDFVLKRHIEKGETAKTIKETGVDGIDVDWVVRRVANNEYKRQQSAPMIIISERDLINGRRMPIVNAWRETE